MTHENVTYFAFQGALQDGLYSCYPKNKASFQQIRSIHNFYKVCEC